MAFLDNPEDYAALGVEPPKVESHGTLDEIMSHKDEHFHSWKQRGIEIFCDEGEHRHGRNVPPDHILIGTDSTSGLPLYNIVDSNALLNNYKDS